MRVSVLLLVPALAASFSLASSLRADEAPRASASTLRDHVAFLASDDLAGRDSGEPGLEIAAEYLANRLAALGLAPAGDNGTYFQHFTVPGGTEFANGSGATIEGLGRAAIEWAEARDVVAFAFGQPGIVEAPLVFCGYGITAGDADRERLDGYDDYADVDVRGKVAVILRFTPRHESSEGPFRGRRSPYAPFIAKIENALEHGAAGVVFVTPTTAPDENLPGFAHRAALSRELLPALFASQAAVDTLLRRAGRSLEQVVAEIDASARPRSFPIDGARIRFSTTRREHLLRNVAARLAGTNPARAHETIVIGGHYDHIGRWGNQVQPANLGQVHNGADDNASGTAGILEAARLLSVGERPERSVDFVAFSGEEIGLHGSRHWVDAARTFIATDLAVGTPPPGDSRGAILWEPGTQLVATGAFDAERFEVESSSGDRGWIRRDVVRQASGPTPLHDVVAMINLDMIGRGSAGRPVEVIAMGSSPDFAAIVPPIAERIGQPITPTALAGGGSDHANFLRRRIPALFFHTGLHRDYNTPQDDVETLDFEVAARVIDIVREVTLELGRLEGRPGFDAAGLAARPGAGRPRLGVRLDEESDEPGVRVAEVLEGTPAAKAGLQSGDVIRRLGDRVIDDLGDLRAALSSVGGKVPLLVVRGGAEVTLTVELAER